MKLAEIVERLDRLAPREKAEAWDNAGLLVGDAAADVTRAMLCIDYTAAVAAEAKAAGCELVVAYHPPLFKPIKRLTATGPTTLLYDAARRGVAIYSPHTALDVAEGGTNDVLADILGLVDRRPLRPAEAKTSECKLVTFVPATHVDAVAAALFAVGAGRIGDYSSCSFRTPGTATFFGESGTHPAVGEAGRLENAAEIKLETVLPLARVPDAMVALRASHPYETPACDLVTMTAPPPATGSGRIGNCASPIAHPTLFDRIRHGLGIAHLLVAGPADGVVRTAAVCAGAGGDFLEDAIAAKADVYLTGELRHHDALRAAAVGMTVVCTLHSHSERATLRHLLPRLEALMSEVSWRIAATDAEPFAIL